MEAAVKSKRFHHNNNEIFTWMASNAICKRLSNEMTTIDKEKRQNKIDGIVAAAIGIGRAMYNDDESSVYTGRGLLMF